MNPELKSVEGTIRIAGENKPHAATLVSDDGTVPTEPLHALILRAPKDKDAAPSICPATFTPDSPSAAATPSGKVTFTSGKISSLALAQAIVPTAPKEEILAALRSARGRYDENAGLFFGQRALNVLMERLVILSCHPEAVVKDSATGLLAQIKQNLSASRKN